jgi:hypothetical protein
MKLLFGAKKMVEALIVLGVVAAVVVLRIWVLPRLGVPT